MMQFRGSIMIAAGGERCAGPLPFTQQVAIRDVFLCLKKYKSEYGIDLTRDMLKGALRKLARDEVPTRKAVITETQRMEVRLGAMWSRYDSVEEIRAALEDEFGLDAVLTLHRYLVLSDTTHGELLLMAHSGEGLLRGVATLLLGEGA